MLFNLLESQPSTTATNNGGGLMWLIILIPVVLLMVMNHFSNKKRKEQQEKELEKRNSIKAGFKVTTIGGILGTVVEVNDEENWFILETGSSENSCHLKFDKVAIYSSEDPNASEETEEDDIVAEDELSDSEETTCETVEEETEKEISDAE